FLEFECQNKDRYSYVRPQVVEEGEPVNSTEVGASSTGTGEATLAGGEENSSNIG
ncbi:hypothetical protein Tco_1356731, partial [Tanacetum coccineum]